ncbi:hypothetical protein RZO07_26910 [Pseudomonas protegens]|uniref:hypothetical protein n=1 Tax=Pseudomonas protegens TaxID=380021 RepID=UPI00293710AD|nr:hypothetical protein [Pseudomonas protegens]WOE78877.1 hypothetical protein RZO07_26910 [Pseudomonas protegens]
MTNDVEPETEDQAPPHCTVPPECQLSFRTLPDDAQWRDGFIETIRRLVEACGRAFDLSDLDGVTVGFDYDDALNSVDLGYESQTARGYTNTEGLVGVGKAMRVRRNGATKTHVVLRANTLLGLTEHGPDTDDFWATANIVAHELAHVQVTTWFEAHSPGVMLAPHQGDWVRASLRDAAHTIWEEYAACRLAAPVGSGELVTTSYTDGFQTAVTGAISKARRSIIDYRTHSDISRLTVETSREVCQPLKMVAYLMGHLDGLGQEIDLEARCAFEEQIAAHLPALLGALREAWDCRESWDGLASLDPVVQVIIDALRTAGIELTLAQGSSSSHVSVPFTAETLPNGEADMAMIRMRRALGLEF